MKKICVLGLGYIGLPTAAMFATSGFQVLGVDVNENILETINNGDIHIYEPGLQTLVQAALKSGNLQVASKPSQAEVFIIAVPTPIRLDKTADMEAVKTAAESIFPFLSPGNLVLLESTSPPGTTIEILVPILERSGLRAGQDFQVAYSPERVLPGQILQELIENARVIGGIDQVSAEAGRDLYRAFVRGDIILTNATTAEMVKLMENTYRDVNIALANEFSRLADRFGVDVWETVKIANLHPRVNILNPGPGVGGHCISVDPWFLVESAPDITPLIRTAREVNDSQPAFIVDLLTRMMGTVEGKRIAALGLSYKPDVNDFRSSPAIEIVRLLAQAGGNVCAYDPHGSKIEVPGVQIDNSLQQSVSNADVIVVLVGHQEFKELSPSKLTALTPTRTILDLTGMYDAEAWEAYGFHVAGLGKRQRL